jgi:hypothetical protein
MLNDIRYALRTLRQNPGFALTAVVSIAMAIGANSAIFSLQDGLLFRPLAIRNPAEVMTITSRPPTGVAEAFRYPDFVELREKNRTFEGLVAYRLVSTPFAKDEARNEAGLPDIKTGFLVSGNFFDLLGVAPSLGRGFRLTRIRFRAEMRLSSWLTKYGRPISEKIRESSGVRSGLVPPAACSSQLSAWRRNRSPAWTFLFSRSFSCRR